MKKNGFTLLELALVLTVIGTLVALAVPGYQYFLNRSRVAEARTVLEAIAHAELSYFRDHGSYLACAPSSATVPQGRQGTFARTAEGWSQIGIQIDGPIWYRYEVVLAADQSFQVIAKGDLDGDGRSSRIVLDGKTLTYEIHDELE